VLKSNNWKSELATVKRLRKQTNKQTSWQTNGKAAETEEQEQEVGGKWKWKNKK